VTDSRATEDLLRELAPHVLGALVRRYGHFEVAEDAVQEALLAAVTQWPSDCVPDNPKAWLITVASRRVTDQLRAEQARRRREDAVAVRVLPEEYLAPPADAAQEPGRAAPARGAGRRPPAERGAPARGRTGAPTGALGRDGGGRRALPRRRPADDVTGGRRYLERRAARLVDAGDQ